MSPPTASERRRRPRRGYGVARPAALLGATLALWSAHCTFPEYDLRQSNTAGTGGSGANSGATAGQGATSGSGSSLGGADTAADGGVAGMGVAGGGSFECGGEQWPLDQCSGGCLRKPPDSCFDGDLNGAELGIDCGGECQRCTNEACTAGNECLSGECPGEAGSQLCNAPVRLVYTSHEQNSLVGSAAWSMNLINDEDIGGRTFVLKDLEVRYYLARAGVVEPIVVRATQSNLQLANGESRELKATNWLVERFEDTADSQYDAYMSVRFSDSGQLFPGDQVMLYQQMLTGETGISTFDQRLSYSFTAASAFDWLHINIFYQGKLLWGLEPRPANPRSCFARGVNLNGPAVSAEGHDFESAAQAAVTTTGSGIGTCTCCW